MGGDSFIAQHEDNKSRVAHWAIYALPTIKSWLALSLVNGGLIYEGYDIYLSFIAVIKNYISLCLLYSN